MKMAAFLVALLVSALLAPTGPAASAVPLLAVAPARWTAQRVLQLDRATGRVVVALGDPARARHLAVVVPGVGVSPATFDEPEWPARRPYGMALAIRELTPDSAVIAWLGYRPPAGLGWEAATGAPAREGAKALRAFVDWLRAGAVPGATIGLVCHSYGSTVCGVAAPGLAVDDLVLLANQGSGPTRRLRWAPRLGYGRAQPAPTGSVGYRTSGWVSWGTARTRPIPRSAPARCPPPA